MIWETFLIIFDRFTAFQHYFPYFQPNQSIRWGKEFLQKQTNMQAEHVMILSWLVDDLEKLLAVVITVHVL